MQVKTESEPNAPIFNETIKIEVSDKNLELSYRLSYEENSENVLANIGSMKASSLV